jgi:hypothetical protein
LGYALREYPKINFMACESHALKHRDDFHCAFFGILGYALSERKELRFSLASRAANDKKIPRAYPEIVFLWRVA